MIEPTSKDIHREVELMWQGRCVVGRIVSFDAAHVYVRLDAAHGSPAPVPVQRQRLTWHIAAGPTRRKPTAAEEAARSLFGAAGLTIEVLAENEWRVGGWLFWPSGGTWRRPDGSPGYGGARPLIEALRRHAAEQARVPAGPPEPP